jgi:peroxiredoxin
MADLQKAPELQVQRWLNTDEALSLELLKGKVVVIFAFQMLCPGCVEHSIPQAKKVNELFPKEDVTVIGLHTVFEHHDAMSEVSLKAFLHEYKVSFPVAVDMPSGDESPIPKTMKTYETRGTPTLLLVDRKGYLRKHKMGHEMDLILGAEIMQLMMEG